MNIKSEAVAGLVCNSHNHRLWNILFYVVIIVTIGLFLYKADYTGTTYDESMTFMRYCDSIHTARHVYDNPNNHVLNSIYTFFASKLFRFYEQYIRIFPMLSGVVFFVGIAYIVKKLVMLPAYQVASLLLVYFVPYTFNFLFMARGYTYALSGMVLYIVLVFYLLDHPIGFRCWPVPVLLFSLINFYVLGAMLGGIYVMICINALFVLLLSPDIYKGKTSRLLTTALHGIIIVLLTGLSLYLLYRPILNEILHIYESPYLASKINAWKGWPSFSEFFAKILSTQVFEVSSWGRYLFYVYVLLLAAGIITCTAGCIKAVRKRAGSVFFTEHRKGLFLLLTAVIYCLILLVYGGVCGRCPGLVRSHVCLLPLVCLVSLWLIEQLVLGLSGRILKVVCRGAIWAFIIVTALHKTPYMHSVFKGGMAMSKPTLERLKALDPERTWNIVFARSMYTYSMEFRYYEQFDTYKFNLNSPNANVLICRPRDERQETFCLDYEYFLKQNNCYVYLFIPPDWDRIILEASPIEAD